MYLMTGVDSTTNMGKRRFVVPLDKIQQVIQKFPGVSEWTIVYGDTFRSDVRY